MTKVDISEGNLVLEVQGWDKLWSLRSHLTIPLEHVARVYTDPGTAITWWLGLRIAGTHMPGVIAAGTFYHDGELVFWDVHDAKKTIIIELHDERYKKLIVEVADPAETVGRIETVIGRK